MKDRKRCNAYELNLIQEKGDELALISVNKVPYFFKNIFRGINDLNLEKQVKLMCPDRLK